MKYFIFLHSISAENSDYFVITQKNWPHQLGNEFEKEMILFPRRIEKHLSVFLIWLCNNHQPNQRHIREIIILTVILPYCLICSIVGREQSGSAVLLQINEGLVTDIFLAAAVLHCNVLLLRALAICFSAPL